MVMTAKVNKKKIALVLAGLAVLVAALIMLFGGGEDATPTGAPALSTNDGRVQFLKDFGWEYIVCDIQWSEPTANSFYYNHFAPLCMDEYSRLIPSVERFPSSANGKGFKPIADYIHALGLKFGIHIMRGIPRQAVPQNLKIKGTNKTAREVAKTNSICYWNMDMYGVDPQKEGAREYYDSILYELKNRSIVEHNMFASAKYSFENDKTLCMRFEDSIVAEKKAEAIIEYIKTIKISTLDKDILV